jgi:ABC-type uncharacterized transport system permease subunit
MSPGIVFHAVAALAYAAMGLGHARRLLLGNGSVEEIGKTARLCLLGALVLHGVALYLSMLGDGRIFIGWALALSAAVWLGLVVYWLEGLFIQINGLQLLLVPAATLVTALAALFPQGIVVPHANSDWLRAHLIISLVAYGLITVAALQSVLMALLDRHLRQPPAASAERGLVARVLDAQPPLLVQERLLFRLIGVGFIALTLAVASGSIASMTLTGRVLPFDHKTVFTLLSWVTFGVLLLGRHLQGWRGRVTLRWTLTGFVFLILAYTGSRFVLEMILHRG